MMAASTTDSGSSASLTPTQAAALAAKVKALASGACACRQDGAACPTCLAWNKRFELQNPIAQTLEQRV